MNLSLTKNQRIKVLEPESLYKIMEQILKNGELIDRDRKQCFVVSLGIGKEILNIELIALGSQESIIIEPLEVFGQSMSIRANSIVMVLYHGNGELRLLEQEMELVKRIHNCGLILNTELADCMVINNESYVSLRDDESLYREIVKSDEFKPAHKIRSEAIDEGWNLATRLIASSLVELGVETDDILYSTRLDSATIQKMQARKNTKRK